MDRPIFHLALRDEWEVAQQAGEYRRSTRGHALEEVGYVHAAFAEQVTGVADRYFQGAGDLVLLELDPGRLGAELRVEALDGATEAFPHVYGPLPVEAVTAVHDLVVGGDGRFVLPRSISGIGGEGA